MNLYGDRFQREGVTDAVFTVIPTSLLCRTRRAQSVLSGDYRASLHVPERELWPEDSSVSAARLASANRGHDSKPRCAKWHPPTRQWSAEGSAAIDDCRGSKLACVSIASCDTAEAVQSQADAPSRACHQL
jgi:hypothetical protein